MVYMVTSRGRNFLTLILKKKYLKSLMVEPYVCDNLNQIYRFFFFVFKGKKIKKWVMLGSRFTPNFPSVGPRPAGAVPSVGVFLIDPSPYLGEFRRKPQKTANC